MLHLDHLAHLVCARLSDARSRIREDAGYTTETIVITALLAILAMTVVGIIVAKVTAKANGISLG
jgi:hypothetical protein